MDCGKEFMLDYSGLGIDLDGCKTQEEFDNKLLEYNKKLGISFPINICSNCLKPLVNLKDSSLNNKKEEIINV